MARIKVNLDIDVSDKMRLSFGYLQPDNPQIIYLQCKSWVSPSNTEECPSKIDKIERKLNRFLSTKLENNHFLDKNKIVDFYFPKNMFIKDKKKYFQFDCIMRQRQNNSIETLKPFMESFASDVSFFMERTFNEYNFTMAKSK